eukprot:13645733-Ditylum_brightwellii.AAC.2
MKLQGLLTIKSASVATDCSRNEQAVICSKLSGVLKRGLYKAGDWGRMNEVWLVWSFQINFMHKPVL